MALLGLGGGLQTPQATSSASSAAKVIDFNPLMPAASNVNWSTVNPPSVYTVDSTAKSLIGGSKDSTDAQNNEIVFFPVYLATGTFTLYLMVPQDANRGIITVYLDGVSKGTLDLYAAAALYNQIMSISSIAVTAGYHDLKFVMATRNGAASGWFGTVQDIRWVQTA